MALEEEQKLGKCIIRRILTFSRFETNIKQAKAKIKYFISRIRTFVFQYEMNGKQNKRLVRLFERFLPFCLLLS